VNGFPGDKQSRLLELLGLQIGLFRQIRELTERQTELLLAEDIDAFDQSLSSRQALIEKIDGLHQESDILMQSYLFFSGSAGGGKIKAIEESAGELRGVIEECAVMDRKNMAMLKEQAEQNIEQIGKMDLGKKSVGAYIQNVPQSPELFDKKT
jgi:hypothetical protein